MDADNQVTPACVTLTYAALAAVGMKWGAFEACKSRDNPRIVYALHDIGTDTGRLVPVDRDYRVIGGGSEFVPYEDPRFAHLYVKDTAGVRALATSITPRNQAGCGPIIYLLADDDTRDRYARRLQSLALCIAKEGQS